MDGINWQEFNEKTAGWTQFLKIKILWHSRHITAMYTAPRLEYERPKWENSGVNIPENNLSVKVTAATGSPWSQPNY